MNWDSFFAEPKYLRAKEGELLQALTDTDCKNLKAVQAKNDMRWDLEEVLGVSPDDTQFSNFLQSNEEYLKEMLALRQLYWFFAEKNQGEGSVSYAKMHLYDKLYRERKARLGSLISRKSPSITALIVTR